MDKKDKERIKKALKDARSDLECDVREDYKQSKYINNQFPRVVETGKQLLRLSKKQNLYINGPVLNKRIDVMRKYEKQATEIIKKYYPLEDDIYSSKRKQWTDICILCSYLNTNIHSGNKYIYLSMAIWMLDQIDKAHNMDKLEELLRERFVNQNREGFDGSVESYDEVIHHTTRHSKHLIAAVTQCIFDRNENSQKNNDSENFFSSEILKGRHFDNSEQRKLYDDIVALIPEKTIKRAVRNTENYIWQVAEIIIRAHAIFEIEKHTIATKTVQMMDDCDRSERAFSKSAKSLNNPNNIKNLNALSKLNVSSALCSETAEMLSPFGNSIPGTTRTTYIFETKRIFDSMERYDIVRGFQSILPAVLLDIYKCGGKHIFSKNFYTVYNGETITPESIKAELVKINDVTFSCSEEVVFGIMHMFDQGNDLAYLLPITSTVFSMAIDNSPWGYAPSHKGEAFRCKTKQEIPQFFKDVTANERFAFDIDYFPRKNIGHLMWILSGIPIVKDTNKYMYHYRKLGRLQMPEEYKVALAFASANVASIKEAEKKEADYERRIQESDEQTEKKEKEKFENKVTDNSKRERELQDKNKNLLAELKREKGRTQDAKEENAELLRRIEFLEMENKSLIESIQNKEDNVQTIEEELFPYNLEHTFVVFSNEEKRVRHISSLLNENFSYEFTDKSNHFTKEKVRNSDVVCIYTRSIGHAVYYAIMDEARIYEKEVIFLNDMNAKMNAMTIMKKDKELSAKKQTG